MVIEGLYYTEDHEWIKVEGGIATVGITDYAQESMGEITFVELPIVGKQIEVHGELAVVESPKAASDIYSPLAGKIMEGNEALESQPELINQDCYNVGWICKLEVSEPGAEKKLMSAAEYEKYLEENS